jgi:hypothetical protein
MNYQKMRDAPMNYQLDQKRASNYQFYTFCPIPSVRPVNMDEICQFWTLILIKRQKCPQLIKKNKIGLLIWSKFINKNTETNIFKKKKREKKKEKGVAATPLSGGGGVRATPRSRLGNFDTTHESDTNI